MDEFAKLVLTISLQSYPGLQVKVSNVLPYSPLFSRDVNLAKISRHISRVFNFAIAEKNCDCREYNFAKLTIKFLFLFYKKCTLMNN